MGNETVLKARLVFAYEQVGLTPPHLLPEAATELLVLGYDSSSLRELAGLPKGDRTESTQMWETVREELGMPREGEEEAARFLLKYWAGEMVAGRLEVLRTAKLMYRYGWYSLGQPEELHDLLNLLDTWDEMPQRREKTTAELRAFAERLLRQWN